MKNLALFGLLLLTSCTLFPAHTFKEKYAVGVSNLQGALATTDALLTSGKISKVEASLIEKQIDAAKEALDTAKSTYITDQKTGGDKLTEALTALKGISTYLQHQQGK